ncbi:Putative peroxiredoxin Rv1608c (Bacterioferritin comigratory protein) (Thioredoxin peroxidase) (Thioredoxin-dependent peroxiredoxin Rv1608c), partial [Durusdinium trenchii]
VGQAFPDFELPDHNGSAVRSSELLSEGPLVVTFYRGGWCPYCNLALRALQDKLPEMKELGANLVAISPQLPDGSLSTAEQNSLEFSVLSDVGLKVASDAGVVWEIPEYAMEWHQKFFGMDLESTNGAGNSNKLPVPATFVIGRDGRVLWRFVEAKYWERANPEDIVNALRSKPVIEQVKGAFGMLPNLMATFAESPAAIEGYLTLMGIFSSKTDFSPTEQQVVLMTNNRLNGCTYCMAAHTGIAKSSGVPDDVIESLRSGTAIEDPKLDALRVFTEQ